MAASRLLDTSIPLPSIQLGRLVLDTRNPHQDFIDPFDDRLPQEDYTQKYHSSLEGALAPSSDSKLRSYLNNIPTSYKWLSASASGLSVLAPTRSIKDPGAWFRDACVEPTTREFIENAIENKSNVYLIVGSCPFQGVGQIMAPRYTTDSGISGIGDVSRQEYLGLYAILYRKVKFKWFSRRTISNMFLETNTRKVLFSGPGEDMRNDILKIHSSDKSCLVAPNVRKDKTNSPQGESSSPKPTSVYLKKPDDEKRNNTQGVHGLNKSDLDASNVREDEINSPQSESPSPRPESVGLRALDGEEGNDTQEIHGPDTSGLDISGEEHVNKDKTDPPRDEPSSLTRMDLEGPGQEGEKEGNISDDETNRPKEEPPSLVGTPPQGEPSNLARMDWEGPDEGDEEERNTNKDETDYSGEEFSSLIGTPPQDEPSNLAHTNWGPDCQDVKEGNIRKDKNDYLREESPSLIGAEEGFEQVHETLETSAQRERSQAHPQPTTVASTGLDTIVDSCVVEQPAHDGGVSTLASQDVDMGNDASSPFPHPLNNYLQFDDSFPFNHQRQIRGYPETNRDLQPPIDASLEEEGLEALKLFERSTNTPTHQNTPSAYPTRPPKNYSSVTPPLGYNHTSSSNHDTMLEEELSKVYLENPTPAQINNSTLTYQNQVRREEAKELEVQVEPEVVTVPITGPALIINAEQELVTCKRTTSQLEDTMWRIKYTISRLEFSIMRAPRRRSGDFTTRVSWKCVSTTSPYNQFIQNDSVSKSDQNQACNAIISDDFLEFVEGGSRSTIPPASGVQQHSGTSDTRIPWLGLPLFSFAKWTFRGKNATSPNPLRELPNSEIRISNSSSSAQVDIPTNKDRYLLLCYNNRWDSIRLLHLDVPPSKKDQELFANIRDAYYTARGWWRCLFSLKVLRHIEFVKVLKYTHPLPQYFKRTDTTQGGLERLM